MYCINKEKQLKIREALKKKQNPAFPSVIVKIGHRLDTLTPYRSSEQNYIVEHHVPSHWRKLT